MPTPMNDENLGKLEHSLLSKRHYCLPQSEPSLPDIPITQKKLEFWYYVKSSTLEMSPQILKEKRKPYWPNKTQL